MQSKVRRQLFVQLAEQLDVFLDVLDQVIFRQFINEFAMFLEDGTPILPGQFEFIPGLV